ncbi:hypothetical protein BsIDN1_51720 [Bacillus safensis]|uniref:Uncharacterized protein n=1 Tax=Bacillus safensis TaxID=561879 RepID=A0A5S9MHD3_BACIA|nr:hypothetical protein BsIDN1_51720 [Bacillus safensis]
MERIQTCSRRRFLNGENRMGLDKKFEKYVKSVCKRIKNKDVHSSVKLELMDHLYTLKRGSDECWEV